MFGPYFGDGDECHMAFHFPLMPRIYMALRQEDRLPITDIMAQTPAIPDNCQWGLFLRNHDELTLEMVSDDERDYMYLAYSADPRMRINIGIRRRLAPLLDNNRRRIELLNSILFSFPGTPILYYGDEIGMGDNIYLGDRNGVRTPMQWTPDRNAGFSRANPAKLYSPVIMDPVFGYEAINVEAQQNDASSLLNWMRNMIALRKLFQVFGRGSLRFLDASNRKSLRTSGNIRARRCCAWRICRALRSRCSSICRAWRARRQSRCSVMSSFLRSQRRRIRSRWGRMVFCGSRFSRRWRRRRHRRRTGSRPSMWRASETGKAFSPGMECGGWRRFSRRICSGNDGSEVSPAISFARRLPTPVLFDEKRSALLWVALDYVEGDPDTWLLCLAMSFGDAANAIRESAPSQAVATAGSATLAGVLHEGLLGSSPAALLEILANGEELRTRGGTLIGLPSSVLASLRGLQPLAARVSGAEQSNTSAIFGDRLIMKLFRRQQPGQNPDVEVGRFLTETVNFGNTPPFGGCIEVRRADAEPATVALLQGLVQNEGDGWQWTLEELDRYYESTASVRSPAVPAANEHDTAPPEAREHAGLYLDAAAVLGRRTAEMHLALASGHDAAFAPQTPDTSELATLRDQLAGHAAHAFDLLKTHLQVWPMTRSRERDWRSAAGAPCWRNSARWTLCAARGNGHASTGIIIWARCCARKGTSSFWISRANRRGRSPSGD
jgi:maltose alpha-D-glucosyltransferase/alpha-amylase